jgi:hypothetical protein
MRHSPEVVALNRDHGTQFWPETLDGGAHAPKVAKPFLTDRRGEDEVPFGVDPQVIEDTEESNRCGDTEAVVADARSAKYVAIASNVNRGRSRKDGVSVG